MKSLKENEKGAPSGIISFSHILDTSLCATMAKIKDQGVLTLKNLKISDSKMTP